MTEDCIDGIRYLWYRTPSYRGNGAARVINILSFVENSSAIGDDWPARYNPDVVIASSTYPLDNLPAHCIAMRLGQAGF